jgi:hypothetical protein
VETTEGHELEVSTPDSVSLSNIEKGDSVFVTYSEAAAISVEPGEKPTKPARPGVATARPGLTGA